MNVPAITGIIRRRILLNYRVTPEIVQSILPANFRPKVVGGHSIAGICLIRLERIRPKGLPAFAGISSENSAHRIAVEWEDATGSNEGVFVPRRDTDSRLNSLAGGRIFPGVHHLSDFTVIDEGGNISMRIEAKDLEEPLVEMEVSESNAFPEDSVFSSLDHSSGFFEAGSIGYSARPDSCKLDGLRLQTLQWMVSPLEVHTVRSAYYDDRSVFPSGSIAFDHALLMRDIAHEWHAEPEMNAEEIEEDRPLIRRRPVFDG